MQFVFFSLVVLFALTGQALAEFNVTLGTKVFFPPDIFNIPSSAVPANCVGNCSSLKDLENCSATNATCLCDATLVGDLQECQQCMFAQLIDQNIKPQDPRVGSTPFLTQYSANCNLTISPLVPPESMNGPFDAVLPVGGTVVAVMAGGFLGISALLLLSNLS